MKNIDFVIYFSILSIFIKLYTTSKHDKRLISQEVDDNVEEHIIILKERVRKMLVPVNEKALQPLTVANLIDSIQRLGLCYHFEREIDEVLQHIYNNYVDNSIITLNEDLRFLALIFRLLRQQGYHISPGMSHAIYFYYLLIISLWEI